MTIDAIRKKRDMKTASPVGSGSSVKLELQPTLHRLAIPGTAAGPIYASVEFLFLCLAPYLGSFVYHSIATPGYLPPDRLMLSVGGVMAGLYLLLSHPRGSFALDEIRSVSIRRPLVRWSLALMCFTWASFALKLGDLFPRGGVMTGFLIGAFGIVALRLAAPFTVNLAFHYRLLAGRRTIFLSDETSTPEAFKVNDIENAGFSVQGWFRIPGSNDRTPSGLDRLCGEVVRAARERHAEEILIMADGFRLQAIAAILEKLRVLPLRVLLLPTAPAGRALRAHRRNLIESALELQAPPLSRAERILKRCLDVSAASVLLLLLSPIFLTIAIMIRLDSRGPVFFRQTRIGFCGRPFMIYKFRSMHTTDDGAVVRQAERGDARITRIGRFLREKSLDELPQLINVVIGDMSLVGPRPHAVAHDRHYEVLIPDYAWRHHALPGITGWAQVTGYRGGTPTLACMEARIERDLWYIRNWSIWLDVKILFLTVLAVLKRAED